MKKRRSIWMMMALIVVVALAGWYMLSVKEEPRYQGKTVNEWFWAISTKTSVPNQFGVTFNDPGVVGVVNLGTNAVPFLMSKYRPKN
jgi:hypothetical protein